MDPKHGQALKRAMRIDGNDVCADCFAPSPTWASTNLGVFLCIKCAGVHRSMGTHISKVKSLSLDKWDDSMVRTVQEIGNVRSNTFFLAICPANVGITENANGVEREAFIRDKYIQRRFAGNHSTAKTTTDPVVEAPSALEAAESSSASQDSSAQIRMPREKKAKPKKAAATARSTPEAALTPSSGFSMFDGLAVSTEQPESATPEPAKKAPPQRRVGASPWVVVEETKMAHEVTSPQSVEQQKVVPVIPSMPAQPAHEAPKAIPPVDVQRPVQAVPQVQAAPIKRAPAPTIDDLLDFGTTASVREVAEPESLLDLDAARVSVENARVIQPKPVKSDDPFADILGALPASQPGPVPTLPSGFAVPQPMAPQAFPVFGQPAPQAFPFLPTPANPPMAFPFMQPAAPPASFPFIQPPPAPANMAAPTPASGFSFINSSTPATSSNNPSAFSFL
eukprot:TRINITY_DN6258_c0_g1_i1.p1 TRINITY_DN6258_c0_g1~~TRINITY_DN6258_c0_g1_i1.p1  ORF type:complete len:451 (+),score=93.59 TRINITY_DN6258_c0_g1_i1:42-1394(+)